MLKANRHFTWCNKAVDGKYVRVAIVVDYPKGDDPKLRFLIDSLEKQGYIVKRNYGSDLTFEELMKDIDSILKSKSPYVLLTRRSELLSNEFGRPDTFFKYYDKSADEKIEFGLASFDSLTEREIREANNIMKLYWGGTFQVESDS